MTLPVNQIVQGDCVQVLKTLPSASVDLVVTDPPYLVNYRDRSGRTVKNDNGGSAGVLAAFSDAYRVLKPHSFCVCFYGMNFSAHGGGQGSGPSGISSGRRIIRPVRASCNIGMSKPICW